MAVPWTFKIVWVSFPALKQNPFSLEVVQTFSVPGWQSGKGVHTCAGLEMIKWGTDDSAS